MVFSLLFYNETTKKQTGWEPMRVEKDVAEEEDLNTTSSLKRNNNVTLVFGTYIYIKNLFQELLKEKKSHQHEDLAEADRKQVMQEKQEDVIKKKHREGEKRVEKVMPEVKQKVKEEHDNLIIFRSLSSFPFLCASPQAKPKNKKKRRSILTKSLYSIASCKCTLMDYQRILPIYHILGVLCASCSRQ